MIALFKRWLPLSLLLTGFFFFFYFHLNMYLTLASLQQHREWLQQWTQDHYWLAASCYCLLYVLTTAMLIPVTVFLTLAGGFLLGPMAVVFVVCSATIGASISFFALKSAFGQLLVRKAAGWIRKMEHGFQTNAFNYLLFLRLIPVFPFWAVNIAAALFAVPARTFILATLFGITPGALIYVMAGHGLNKIFATNATVDFHIIFSPSIFLPLLGFAVIVMLPVLVKKWKNKS